MSVLGLYYDGQFHDLSLYVVDRGLITEYPSGSRWITNFQIFAAKSDEAFLDTASRIKKALKDAEEGNDLVRLVRQDGADAPRYFSVFSGSVIKLDDQLWWRYTVSTEHIAEGETLDSVAEELHMNLISFGTDRIAAVSPTQSYTGDRPARIAEMVVHSDIAGIRIDGFWAGIKPDATSFQPEIDFPNSFLGIGNERSNDTVAAAGTGLVEINFTVTEDMIHRFESKFGFRYEPGGGNPAQETGWNSQTRSNPDDYPGRYRLLMRWNASNISSAFLVKVYAGFKDALQLVGTKFLQATAANRLQVFEIGEIEMPGDAELDHYSVRVSAARLSGSGLLRFGSSRLIPQEYSIKVGSKNMGVRKGQPETPLIITTDSYGRISAYAKGAYDTARPLVEAKNWSNPGGVMVVHVDTRAAEAALDDQDALTINMTNVFRYGLHTPFIQIVEPTIGDPIGGG